MKHHRTHTCGELRKSHVGETVCLMGWVNSRRDHGGVRFVNLRDRYGITQIVFDEEKDKALFDACYQLKNEYVIAVVGVVRERLPNMINPDMVTGDIEIEVKELETLAAAKTPPFTIEERDQEIGEDLRLAYRYLDLRKPVMQRNLITRHKAAQAARTYLNGQDFLEIETPYLMKRTPEGARDYLVPSRLYWGQFYALPQSPQIYKQLLMLSGYDRYYQIVKCFRDEDLRADRQPEFTQIDIETSFLHQDEILTIVEGLLAHIYQEVLGVSVSLPMLRMPYGEAMARFGSDKPDLRFGMELIDLAAAVENSGFKVFSDTLVNNGQVKAIKVDGGVSFSRGRLDKLTDTAKKHGAKGLVWIKVNADGIQSPIAKFLSDDAEKAIVSTTAANPDDLLLIVADQPNVVANTLGRLRLELGKELDLIRDELQFLWVTEFPLLEWDEDTERWAAMHHPFTAPLVEDVPLFDSDPGAMRAQAYDLVLNGVEIGGGSIRVHQREVQDKMFKALSMTPDEARDKFGFLLEAFEYGAPPHGGIALGFDRLVALLAGEDNIRQVIAFPKTNRALSLMDGAPGRVEEKLLEELGLSIKEKK